MSSHPFEPEMIVNDLENLRLRIEALPVHPRYTDAGQAIAEAKQAVRDARVDLHHRAIAERFSKTA